ncbi:YraN family protein [Selenomonas sp. TAMA-11512]|uniref:YraN family protein n=1 Tax=Selenomonas sp. TAMA-11512 TaxID=3095337 RepID=UPI0030878D4B|nr:YraN family protein [Selenomonas sp. TAMA-11512]
MNVKEIGNRGERLAAQYLERQGFRILERQYRTRTGEIDLIARQGAVLVFVEVKTRHPSGYGRGAQSVDRKKQERIARTALIYAQKMGTLHSSMRFDVIEIHLAGETDRDSVSISHYENAFEMQQMSSMFV